MQALRLGKLGMPKIDIASVEERRGAGYPPPFDEPCAARVRKALGDAAGLTDFGVNLLQLPPGAWSSQRHWHSREDEFVFVVSGDVVLVTDEGETTLHAGDCAGFPKAAANGHHLINRGVTTAVCLEVGTRSRSDVCSYSDIDMVVDDNVGVYTHKDGKPYPKQPA
jgi:uncharacterized cupin superfamily protein